MSLFAGLFADPGGPVNATLTARRQDNTVAATVTKPIGVGITTPMSVTSAAPDIVKWELSDDSGGSELAFDDLSYEIPDNLVPQIALRGPVQTVPVLQGSHTDVPVSVTRLNGSDGPVHFSVSGLPNGVAGTVTPDPLPGTQSDATLHLNAATDATTTFFTNATLTADPQGNASVAAAPATAPFSVRVASSYELRANDTSTLHLPPCAPADRSFRLDRDFSFAATASLSIEGVPPGVSASIVEGTTIAPGGGFNVDRTLRVSRTTQDIPAGSAITIRARAPGFPDKTLSIPIDAAAGSVTIGGPTSAGTARLLHPGTTVTLNGNGFCPGSSVSVGNAFANADTTVAADGKSLTFVTPRAATTGRVVVKPPNSIFPYQTPTDLTVGSFRGEGGFAFPNFHFGALSLSEFTEAFGADDLFIQINPCWPWGSCYVPTGILDPIAAIEWPAYNLILRGGDGHCYGMNRAVQELLARKTSFARWDFNAHEPFQLPDATGPQNGLTDYLDSRQALQLSSEALINRFDRDNHLSTQLERIHDELAAGRYPGVVMKTGTVAGHEITAYDMERQPDGSTKIFGYDNNRPLTQTELTDPLGHDLAETSDSVITVNPAGDHWTFTAPSGSVWSGGADDGKLYAVTLSDIPDNPSLPGLSDIPLIVADIIASVDGAAQAGPPPPGGASDPLSDQAPGSSGAAEEITAPKGARTLNQTVEGVHKGTYSQLVLGTGFVGGVRDIATDAGVTDTLKGTPSDGALTFGGERNRALNVNLGIDHGEVHRQATVATQASKGGADTVALGNGSALRLHAPGRHDPCLVHAHQRVAQRRPGDLHLRPGDGPPGRARAPRADELALAGPGQGLVLQGRLQDVAQPRELPGPIQPGNAQALPRPRRGGDVDPPPARRHGHGRRGPAAPARAPHGGTQGGRAHRAAARAPQLQPAHPERRQARHLPPGREHGAGRRRPPARPPDGDQGRPGAPGLVGQRRSDRVHGGAVERRRRAAQQPLVAVADQLAAGGQRAERHRDRRPPRAHEVAQGLVGERQPHAHAVGSHAAPAVGGLPEQHEQPAVDAALLAHGQAEGQRARAPEEPAEEHVGQRGPAGGDGHHAPVEDGEPQLLVHPPGHVFPGTGVPVGPGPQEVAGAEQLGRGAGPEPHLARQQAVEQEVAQSPLVLVRAVGGPRSPGDQARSRDRVAAGDLALLAVEDVREIGVRIEEVDRRAGHEARPGYASRSTQPVSPTRHKRAAARGILRA